jgi:hypothetical protein
MDTRVNRFRAEAVQQGIGGVGSRYPLELRRLAVSVSSLIMLRIPLFRDTSLYTIGF